MEKERNKSVEYVFTAFLVLIVFVSSVLTFGFFYEFLPNFLPVELVGENISKVLSGLFGLLVFDIGSLVWLYVHLKISENDSQRTIAIFASGINFAGSLITSFTYLVITGQKLYNLSDDLRQTIGFVSLLCIAGVLVYNFFSVWMFKKNSDESITDIMEGKRQQRLKDAFLQRQKMLDKAVEAEVRKRFNEQKTHIANQIADSYVQKKIEEELGRHSLGTVTEQENGYHVEELPKV